MFSKRGRWEIGRYLWLKASYLSYISKLCVILCIYYFFTKLCMFSSLDTAVVPQPPDEVDEVGEDGRKELSHITRAVAPARQMTAHHTSAHPAG